MKYYVESYSDANTPPVYKLYNGEGAYVKTLEENADLKAKLGKLSLGW